MEGGVVSLLRLTMFIRPWKDEILKGMGHGLVSGTSCGSHDSSATRAPSRLRGSSGAPGRVQCAARRPRGCRLLDVLPAADWLLTALLSAAPPPRTLRFQPLVASASSWRLLTRGSSLLPLL